MDSDYQPIYLKQTDQPLFPKILWNRPVSRRGAGRLLLIGGHKGEFSQLQSIYQLTLAAGAGECRVVMPDSLRKLLAEAPDSSFVPSSPSGSLGRGALGEILDIAKDFDAVAIGANLSNNSETSILVESLLSQLKQPVVLFADGLAAIHHQPKLATTSPNALIVANMQELLKLAGRFGTETSTKPEDGVLNKIKLVSSLSNASNVSYILIDRSMVVAAQAQASLTVAVSSMNFFASAIVAVAAVLFTQNPSKPFEALTTAAYILQQARAKLTTNSTEALLIKEIEAAIRDGSSEW